jgi:energy-coupling factor transport system ATP-binding protein
VNRGELFAIVGGNGAGKTTVLSVIAGLLKPHRGKVRSTEKAILLPQDPQTLWTKKTIREELDTEHPALQAVIRQTEIEPLLSRHPYDVSAGEQQRVALAKVLLREPKLLLMDEPTAGIDSFYKTKLAKILKSLTASGTTIVMVSHDIEFCASYADRCALIFDGAVVSSGAAKEFFSGNSFYTTAANRMSLHIVPGLVTVEDIIASFSEGTEGTEK